jgi:hypothetical protein
MNNSWLPETRVECRYLKFVISKWVHKAILTAKFPTEVDAELRRLAAALPETDDKPDDGSDTDEEEYSDEESSDEENEEMVYSIVFSDY